MPTTLYLYDTLTRQKKPIVTGDGAQLRFYCCGPTVYGPAHIGNFRTFIIQDLFRRVVELSGKKIRHVRNLTDVDDKTIRESQSAGVTLAAFTRQWKQQFHQDAAALHLLPPDVEPSAVGHISEQIAWIKRLVERGCAYQGRDNSVYFRTAAFTGYGKLSHLPERQLKPSQPADPCEADGYDKEAVSDFVLWKAYKPADGANACDSPWGAGRPGWHIECSAMSIHYLGETLDVHSGGVDLIFPHHDNEIAQSEADTGKPFARHWFHIAHLLVEGKKMSKSLGNLYTVEAIQAQGYTADELRYTLLMGHYRQPQSFTFASLQAAHRGLQRLGKVAVALRVQAGHPPSASYQKLCTVGGDQEAWGPFVGSWAALLEDLNTPQALGALFTALRPFEKAIQVGRLPRDQAGKALLGLQLITAAFGWHLPQETAEKVPAAIQELAERRWQAKQQRDWATADTLRVTLAEAGWQVQDTTTSYNLIQSE